MAQNFVTRRVFAGSLGAAGLCLLGSRPLLSQGTAPGSAGGPVGRIDTHHHILPPEYVRLVGRAAIGRPSPSGAPDWDVDASLRVMDGNGIAAAVVSISAPGIWSDDVKLAKRLARSCNEFAAQMAADHPGRFGFFAALPLPDVKTSLAELGHAVETLKCDGVGLMTNYGTRYLGDGGFSPVFEEMNRRGLVVYVHPDTCRCDLDVVPGIPSSMVEFPHSTTRTILSLLASDAFTRWPNIRFIFSHAGGTIPFLVNRIALQADILGKQGWLEHLHRLYYDTAGSANAAAFGPLLKLVTSKQVLFGSDFPFAAAAGVKGSLASLRGLGLSTEEVGDIEGANARSLFRRFATRAGA
jgi:predicted TIM-barrel fold metal-dependent hydrolase